MRHLKLIFISLGLLICSIAQADVGDSFVYDNILYTITTHDDAYGVYEVEITLLPMQEYINTPAIVHYNKKDYKITSYNPSILPYCEECFETNTPNHNLHITKIDLSKSIYLVDEEAVKNNSMPNWLLSGGIQIDTFILPPNLVYPMTIMPFYSWRGDGRNYKRMPCISTLIVTNPNSNVNTFGFANSENIEEIDISIVNVDSLTRTKNVRFPIFQECWSLKKVKLPKQLKYISSETFVKCYHLTEAKLPYTLEYIGNGAFAYCKLDSLFIPANVSYLEPNFLSFNYHLKKIEIDSLNKHYESKDGVVYTKGRDTIHVIPYALELDTLFFQHNISAVNDYAFSMQPFRSSFPGSEDFVQQIYDSLNMIRHFIANTKLKHLGERAFFYSPIESFLNFEKTSVNVIPYECFQDSRIKNIKFPTELTTIEKCAFLSCEQLESVEFTREFTSKIDSLAFADCPNLKRLDLSKQKMLNKISYRLCGNCSALKVVKLPNAIKTIEDCAFINCVSLDTIEVPILDPIPINENVFEGVDKTKCKLIVPQKSIDKYRNAPVWKEFFNIEINEDMLCLELKCDTSMGSVNGSGVYNHGEEVIIYAIPHKGYDFIGWSDDPNYKQNYRLVTVNSDMEITAFFAPKEEKVKLELNCDSTMGFVVGSGTYNKGEKVEIKATPYEGYLFNGWSDNADITTNEREIIVNSDMKITAYFTEDETKTDIETITAPTTPAIQKIIRDGQVFIIRDGKTYNIMGVEVKNVE